MFDVRVFIALGIIGGLFMMVVGLGGSRSEAMLIGGTILIGASMISASIVHKNSFKL